MASKRKQKTTTTTKTNLKLNTVIGMIITSYDVTSVKWFELFKSGAAAAAGFNYYKMINEFYRFCSHAATNSLMCIV